MRNPHHKQIEGRLEGGSSVKSCVLLSTFNGERYVAEQIRSLTSQSIPPDYLLIRDDGSSDNTIEIILSEAVSDHTRLMLHRGSNVGAARSFIELFSLGLSTDADIFFFCDQDDIWEANKVSTFLRAFSPQGDMPEAVFSQLLLVDKNNTALQTTRPPRRIGFGNSLIENVLTGCGLACNRSLLLMASREQLRDVDMHDHLIYVVGSLFGEIQYIEEPLTRYRQHDNNVIGYSTSTWMSIRRKLSRLGRERKHSKSRLASILISTFDGELQPDQRTTLRLVARSRNSVAARIQLILSRRLWRQKRMHELTWRSLCILGLF